MSEKEKDLMTLIEKAVRTLPEHKKEYLKGYAEGIEIATRADADAADKTEDATT